MTIRDDGGNVAIDFVWGNFPLQPDDDRTGDTVYVEQVQDSGWTQAVKHVSETLDPELDGHSVATTGYSNFPGYIPNYAGDGDTQMEIKIPNLVRMNTTQAQAALDPYGLYLFVATHNLTASYVVTTGKTVRVTAYDENWQVAGGGKYLDTQLIGLKVGDQLTATLSVDGDDFSFTNAKVTALYADADTPENSWFEFETETATSPAIDFAASGTIYAGTNLLNKITAQRSEIRNPGQQVNVRVIGD